MKFAIIGAGMAGILSAIKLTEAGFEDVVVIEKADGVGGTWRHNTYPGVACDVPSHLYSYSFDLNPRWSHIYSPGDEIRQYFERVTKEHDIERLIRFGEEVIRCDFSSGSWDLQTDSGFRDTFDVVIAATGVLHHPQVPAFKGLGSFEGDSFHSSKWDHDVAIEGRRVGVIGTGSTAVQLTTALVDQVAHLDLYQRTAQWILPQENPPYSPEDMAGYEGDPTTLENLHNQLSELFAAGFADAVVDADSPQIQMIADACLSNLEDSVADPTLREQLRPDYKAACKRLVASPNFYDAMQQSNADLVTADIDCIEPNGIRTSDRKLHELDVIVFATGFKVDAFMRPMEVTGRGGVQLSEVWADRPTAYLSMSIPEFPNFFMLNGPNGPVGNFSLIEVAELQFDYIMQLIGCLTAGRAAEISATQAATDEFEAARVEAAKSTVWVTGCKSWYLDDRGVPAAWPWRYQRFRDEMESPNFDAYELRQ